MPVVGCVCSLDAGAGLAAICCVLTVVIAGARYAGSLSFLEADMIFYLETGGPDEDWPSLGEVKRAKPRTEKNNVNHMETRQKWREKLYNQEVHIGENDGSKEQRFYLGRRHQAGRGKEPGGSHCAHQGG